MSSRPENPPSPRERELFLDALEKPTPEERAQFLDEACAGDPDLAERIEQLLSAQRNVGGFLERPAMAEPPATERGLPPAALPDTVRLGTPSEKPGDRIGRYKLLQQIGEGGCGVVYMAEQEEPVRRRVALKVIKLGMDTKSVIARFEVERQALAMMDHPNIAKVLDAGATETGRPYFVMELVRGVKITEYCDQNHLPPSARLELFEQVCLAIQHAHQKGVIHRDVKPSNILVTLHDGVPVPKVIDFGIAKATEQRLTAKTLFTEFTAFIGTPAYMSPEQAEMSGLDIDTRSDIYSLGVVLYELLTGKTPFDAQQLLEAGLDECRRTIREQEPIRPSTRIATMVDAELTTTARERQTDAPRLVHLLRGDLDWVVMKCLEKDRTRRFATVMDLANDIQRYLADEPVLARPPSNIYRLRKLLHRHRVIVSAAAAVSATLLIGAGVSIWQAVRATHAEAAAYASQHKEASLRRQAERDKAFSLLNQYVADINLAQKNLVDGNYGKAVQLLNLHLPKNGEHDLRGFEWRYLAQLCRGDDDPPLPSQGSAIQSLACSPDGRWLAVGLRDRIRIWDIRTKALVKQLESGPGSVEFTPDGRTLITADPRQVRLWRVSDWTEEGQLPRSAGPIALSADGARLAARAQSERGFPFPGRGEVRVWETSGWQELGSAPGAFRALAFSPDNQTLAVEMAQGVELQPLSGLTTNIVLQDSTNLFPRFMGPMFAVGEHPLAFSPDGKWVVAARNTLSERGVFVLSVWDTKTGRETGTIPTDPEHVEHTGFICNVAFLPDGKTLVTASWDHSIRLWDFEKRQVIRALHGHLSEVRALAIFKDGQTIVSGSKDGAVKFWKTEQPQKEPILAGWEPITFSTDSRRLAVHKRSVVGFFNVESGELEQEVALAGLRERFGPRPPPEERGGGGGGPRERPRPMGGGGPHGGPGGELDIALSGDFTLMAQGQMDGTVKLWNLKAHETNQLRVADDRVGLVALSPDGTVLVTAAHGPAGRMAWLRWWDLRTGTNGTLQSEATRAWFSRDGKTLVAHSWTGSVELWDMSTHALKRRIEIGASLTTVALSPDGHLLAATVGPDDPDNAVRLWDAATGKLVGNFSGHKQFVCSIAFSADGATLASASDDSTVKLWNVQTQQELLSVRRLGGGLRDLRFSPDGQWLVGGSGLFAQKGGMQFFHAPFSGDTGAASVRP